MASLSNLPDELIILIAEACDAPDKARLARSNRRLNDLATRVLLRYSVQEEGNSAMYWAAEHGHINTLEKMRSCGAEVNDNSGSRLDVVVRRLDSFPRRSRYTSAGFFPLHIAAKFGQDAVITWLLNNGARVESLAQHVCKCAPSLGDVDAGGGAWVHAWTPLHTAICSGNVSTARLLISRGAFIRSQGSGPFLRMNVLHTAARRNNVGAIEFLVGSGLAGVDETDSMGSTALHYACSSSDNLTALKKLVHLGASLDIIGQRGRKTPLRQACEAGFFDGAIELLDKGAIHDISGAERAANLLHIAVEPYLSFPRRHTSSDPAIWEERREDFIRRLVALGVNIDARIRSETPLTVAAGNPRSLVRTLQFLLELGADVNAADRMRRNPIYFLLHETKATGFHATTTNQIDLLLRYGARLDLQADDESCAFDMALDASLSTGDVSIMEFIFQHGLVANYGRIYLDGKIKRSYGYQEFEECRLLASQGAVLKLSDKQLDDDLRFSVHERNLKRMHLLLDLFPDRTEPFELMKMAIEHYIKLGNREVIISKSLLARPEFDSPGSNAASRLLQVACRHHSPVLIAELLLEKGGQVNEFDSWWETPLSCAVACGCRPMVRLLLLRGADPHLAPPERDWSAYISCQAPYSDPQHPDFGDTQYPTSFIRAIRELHCHGDTHGPCHPGGDETLPRPLELILEHLPLPPLPQDPRALSYVHFALEWPEALRALLAKGADPNSGGHCARPPLLHFLTIADRLRPARPDALRILLEFGADIHRTDDQGRSFLTVMRRSTLAMANFAIGNADYECEGLGFVAGLQLSTFFITQDEKSGEDCVKPWSAIAEANSYGHLDQLAACNDGEKEVTLQSQYS